MDIGKGEKEYRSSGNIVLDSLMRARAKHAQNVRKWQDTSRFSKVTSKVKKEVKVDEEVKQKGIEAKIAQYKAGTTTALNALYGQHQPNSRTIGLWANVIKKTKTSRARSTKSVAPKSVKFSALDISFSSPEPTLKVPKKKKKRNDSKAHNNSVYVQPGKRLLNISVGSSSGLNTPALMSPVLS